jgi:TldD protein
MLDEDLVKFFASRIRPEDYGDIRLAESSGTLIEIEKGRTRSTSSFAVRGFGVRVLHNGAWGFASSTRIGGAEIKKAIDSAYRQVSSKLWKRVVKLSPETNIENAEKTFKEDPQNVSFKRKLDTALEADSAARAHKGVTNTLTVYGDAMETWLVGNSAGSVIRFNNSFPRLSIAVFAKDPNTTNVIRKTIDGNCGFEIFRGGAPGAMGKAAAKEALSLLGAKPVKGGKYDVVLDPDMAGVYAHEAIGHASEADGVVSNNSMLAGRLGEAVGPESITIIDDPTITGASGSFSFDSEGSRSIKRTIIDRGVINEYLHTLETASRLNMKANGAARASNPTHPPIARMSNTFIKSGEFKSDIIEDIKFGVAFYGMQYGYTDPRNGNFMFKSQYGRIIRNGKLREYVRDAALTGNTLDVLKRVDAVSSNFALEGGSCGKEEQWVPVTSGGPSIRIRGVVVGGQ